VIGYCAFNVGVPEMRSFARLNNVMGQKDVPGAKMK